MKYSKVEICCTECGSKFLVKKYLVSKPTKEGRFCSPSCRGKFWARKNPACQPDLAPVDCSYCGTRIYLQRHRILDRNFCSNSCRGKYGLVIRWPTGAKLVSVRCSQCDKEKKIPAWERDMREKRNQEQFFCDTKCFGDWKSENWGEENNPSWRGGHESYYGMNWQSQARKARERDGYTCQNCGIKEEELGRALDVHHIVRFGDFKGDWRSANELPNLVCYCHVCHMKKEPRKTRKAV